MQLNIYHLARLGVTRYDEASAFVVIAASPDEARRIAINMDVLFMMASDDAGDEGAYTWVDPADSSCEVIGTALPDAVPGSIIRSFHAG